MPDVAVHAANNQYTEHIGWHHHHIDRAITNPNLLLNMNAQIQTKATTGRHHKELKADTMLPNKRTASNCNNPSMLTKVEIESTRLPLDLLLQRNRSVDRCH